MSIYHQVFLVYDCKVSKQRYDQTPLETVNIQQKLHTFTIPVDCQDMLPRERNFIKPRQVEDSLKTAR